MRARCLSAASPRPDWIAAAVVLLTAAFPDYAGRLF